MDPLRPLRPGPGHGHGHSPAAPTARGLRGLVGFSPRLPSPGPAPPRLAASPFPALFRGLGLDERPVERPLGRGGAGDGKVPALPGPVQRREEEKEDKGAALAALPTRGQILWKSIGDSLPTQPGRAAAAAAPSPQPCLTPVPTPETPPAAGRPRPGTKPVAKGAPVPVGLNFVKIRCQNEAVYQYHVTFSPEVECRAARLAMVKEQHAVIGDVMAFDGSILFLPIQIPKVSLKAQRKSSGEEISISIQMTKILEPSSDLCIPFYNVVFRRVMKILNMSPVGRHFFEPAQATILQKYRLHIWPGYAVSIRRRDGGLFLMVDAIHKIVRCESVLRVMQTIHSQSQRTFQDECTKQLVGSVVITRYNNRTYRVDDIDWDKTPKDTFTMATGQEITFMDYYRKTYGITIRELDQPLLIHKPKEKQMPGGRRQVDMVLLVPELAFLTGLSDLQNSRMLKEVTWEMIQSPQQHYQHLTSLLRRIRDTPEASRELERWGLCLDRDIYRTQGHILPTERINLQHRSFLPAEDLGWHREVTKEVPITVVSINSWLLIYPKRLQQLANDLLAAMRSSCGAMGMQVGKPTVQELRDDRIDSYVRAIQGSLGSQNKVQLLLCLIPSGRDDIYGAIKKLCCVQIPVPSQVISTQSLMGHRGKIRSVVQKVLLQINCKLGGQLWGVDIPLKELMVVGVDIHHSRSQGMHSVIGFVASMNNNLTKWYSKVVFQLPHQEIADSVRLCLSQALEHFYKLNHSLPMKIVVYRDGVSDPQLDTVLEYEVPQLQKSFHSFRNYQPSLVVVVVQKQLNTNFYCLAGEEFVPPPLGTVIDHSITSTDWQDFFLMAHHSRQGCSVPTRYICVWNTANLSSQHLQRLTFKLCHLYWNWPGTVRVPAPCKYAHKLAFLVGQVLHREPSAHLSQQLFYL